MAATATATANAVAVAAASSCGSLGVKENESGNWVSGTVCMAFVAVCVPCAVCLCVCVLLWVSGLPLALSFFFALLSLCAAAFVVNNDSDLLTRLASTWIGLPRLASAWLGLVWFGLTCLLLVASLPHI